MTCAPCTCFPAQAEDCSPTSSLATNPSSPSSGTPTVAESCASEPQTDGFRGCTCTRETFGCSIHPNTPAEWIASQRASLARMSAMLERELVSAKEPEAGFTAKSCALLGQYDRATCSWKTSQQSFLCLEPSSVIWPRSGMTVDGLVYALPTVVPRISGIGGGVWLSTPTAQSKARSQRFINGDGNQRMPNPEEFLRMWPTPTVSSGAQVSWDKTARQTGGTTLAGAVKAFPTFVMNSDGGKLNPEWVEWLMGFPIGYTASRDSGTPKCRSKQR